MTDFEKHIMDQRRELDGEIPREGHEARFLKKLERQPVRQVRLRHVLQIAASIAVILASAFVLIQQNKSGSKVAEAEIPASVVEAEEYYTTQVNLRYDQIRQFEFSSAEEKAVLLDELKDLDTYHRQLLIDLEANPGDDRVISALIRHYRVKLEVMDQIIYQLNQFKTDIDKNNEKDNV
jgi:hypothetical protein